MIYPGFTQIMQQGPSIHAKMKLPIYKAILETRNSHLIVPSDQAKTTKLELKIKYL